MTKINIYFTSLGCDKNKIDTENMLGLLKDKEYNIINDETLADIIVVNTCCFIDKAKEESINTILELALNKINAKCKFLIVAGCLAERYNNELIQEIPEIDAIIGTGNFLQLDSTIKGLFEGKEKLVITDNINYDINFENKRFMNMNNITTYVKIAEGCNNNCSYCIIPKVRGKYRSRLIENILKEVNVLVQNGVKEIILVAQDTSKYGIDLYKKKMLVELLREISKINEIEWIRIMYCYPEDIDNELINEIKNNSKICKYIDMPIQHINNKILKGMKRRSSKEKIINTINKIRQEIPEIVIRTSLIVGFPGETDEQFEELCDFLKEYKLERVGVFTYSKEEGTEAALLQDQIDDIIKINRQRKIYNIQNSISKSINKCKIGKIYKTLIEEKKSEEVYVGRTYCDAPSIDELVYIKSSDELFIGEFYNVVIKISNDYKLIGEVYYESCE